MEEQKFRFRQGILYCHGEEDKQLVVPRDLRVMLLQLRNFSPWAGHLGKDKAWQRVAGRFYWPNMYVQLKQ